jgi:uncharacterized protein
MPRLRFEWDQAKNISNARKHGVGFELAARVFADPLALSVQDRTEHGEQRWRTIGRVEGFLILIVAHTIRDVDDEIEIIRIISARKAERRERRRYEEEAR